MPTDDTFWIALVSELAFDLVKPVLPLLDPPSDDVARLSDTLKMLVLPPSPDPALYDDIKRHTGDMLAAAFGDGVGQAWMRWIASYPCDSDDTLRAPYYWSRFMLDAGPSDRPVEIGIQEWTVFMSLYDRHGIAALVPGTQELESVVSDVVKIKRRYQQPVEALEQASRMQPSAFDIAAYVRIDRNPFTDGGGAPILETGLSNAEVGSFWRAIVPLFTTGQQRAIGAAAAAADRHRHQEMWASKTFGVEEAGVLGVSREQFLIDTFPEPQPPPPLADLAGLWGLTC